MTLAVLELIEAGRLAELQKKWWYEKGECSGKDGPPKKVCTPNRKVSIISAALKMCCCIVYRPIPLLIARTDSPIRRHRL